MLKKLFGGKSKNNNGFYAELKEDITDSVSNLVPAVGDKVAAAKEVVEDKVAAAKDAVGDKVAAAKDAVGDKVAEARDVVGDKVTEAKQTSKNTVEKQKNKVSAKKTTKKTSVKSEGKKATEANNGQVTQVNSDTSYSDTPFWVKAMYKNKDEQKAESETTFATDYLMPTPTTYRRRPGPSLNMFKDMARQAKTRRS